jgi:hypothetical protein
MPGMHHEDLQLRATLCRVFDEEAVNVAQHPPASNGNPHLLRNEAYTLLHAEDRAAALEHLNRAIAVDPYHPVQYQVRRELLETTPAPEP